MKDNLLSNHYLQENESYLDALSRASWAYCGGDPALAERLVHYAQQKWFMYSSPMLSNAPPLGEPWGKGLPIACFGGYVDDTIQGLCDHTVETRHMSVAGGGVGGYWGDVRFNDNKSPGPIPFLHTIDADMIAYHQGRTRRGAYAATLDIYHPDIEEFISIRTPTGDDNRKCFNLHHAVNIDYDFIEAVTDNTDINLICPRTKDIIKTISARYLWEKILETRARTGEPYIHNVEESNIKLPQSLKDHGKRVHHSNLCVEVTLPTSKDESFVCCLSSVNLALFDEWKNTGMVGDLVTMLDNGLDIFINNAPPELHRAVRTAREQRAIGLGAMGFHSYLQRNGMAFDSYTAMAINKYMFKTIKDQAVSKSQELGMIRGSYPLNISNVPMRNSHLLAIAPNANSSILLGVSPGIDPLVSNYYTQSTRAGVNVVKNRYLIPVLERYDINNEETWRSIASRNGSVQHLACLTGHERSVFKTAFEIDQNAVIKLARDRQRYICQAQSTNLFFPSGSNRGYVNSVHRKAFSLNGNGDPLKTLYYFRTQSSSNTEYVSNKIECVGCD